MRQLKISKSITNRESQSIEKYLQEIGKEDLLTPEEEVELARRIRQGDQTALEKLTRANLRFVVSVAKQYQNNSLSLNDLINEGLHGPAQDLFKLLVQCLGHQNTPPCVGTLRLFSRGISSSMSCSGRISHTAWSPTRTALLSAE